MLATVTHILPLTKIRRARMLPVPGSVLVRERQKVNATDVIAQANIDSRHSILDIRRMLRLARVEEVDALLQCKVGDKLEKGDVIAKAGGLIARYVRAPIAGEVMLIAGGQVLLESHGKPYQLIAGVPGTVTEVIPERGVILETDGALVQGVWGNGKIDLGLLLNLLKQPTDEFVRTQLDVSMRGAVILAGYCGKADALQATTDLALRGLILTSMSSDLIPVASGLKFPVIVLEGFGQIPLSPPAYRLLASSERHDITVNALAWDPFMGDRPELIIPLAADGQIPPETDEYKPNQTVRIQGRPYTGRVGQLAQVKPGFTTLASGIHAPAGEVLLETGERVVVPLANLEVIE